MTEADWNSSSDPQGMLAFLWRGGSLSARKARLFAVACCRSIWDLLQDKRSRAAVAASERYADGDASPDELESAFRAALQAYETNLNRAPEAAWLAAHPLTRGLADSTACAAAIQARLWRKGSAPNCTDEEICQADLVRDIFGPRPCRLVNVAPAVLAWDAGVVVKLAEAAYQERQLPSGVLDNVRLMVLADALEEAGCADAALLWHLRDGGPHVRGCHAVDLLLNKR
jgi:hypothetical protein